MKLGINYADTLFHLVKCHPELDHGKQRKALRLCTKHDKLHSFVWQKIIIYIKPQFLRIQKKLGPAI